MKQKRKTIMINKYGEIDTKIYQRTPNSTATIYTVTHFVILSISVELISFVFLLIYRRDEDKLSSILTLLEQDMESISETSSIGKLYCMSKSEPILIL